jgi:ferredoxin
VPATQTDAVIGVEGLEALVAALRARGYRVVGPVVRDRAIVYDELESAADLPIGWTDVQDGGVYRLERRDDEARFGYAVGPHSWKQLLFPPRVSLWRARDDGTAEVDDPTAEGAYAFIGVRSCELSAIAIQDRIFLEGRFVERDYAARRRDLFVVALECGTPSGTCFCVSMETGPGVDEGFDLALTEILDGGLRYLARAGSERGAEVLAELPSRPAEETDRRDARAVVDGAAQRMGRHLETEGLKELLYDNLEHPRWDEVTDRCLTCGNCVLVCPTCFCTSVEEVTDLAGSERERVRVWDTCFSVGHAYVHGGSVRPSPRSRYRQWMTHKLGTWWDQFGTSGCVGCGRCISWCPVGIDITEEAAAIRATPEGGSHAHA